MDRFENILVYVGTKDPETALRRAFEIAKENRARLTLMDVVKPLPAAIGMLTDAASPDELEELLREDRRQKLVALGDRYRDPSLPVEVHVACGDAAHEITRRVLAADHDLVVKTADGETAAGRLFASIARSLLRICPCPVYLLKPEVHGEFDQVLAAIDVDAEDDTHRKLNADILEFACAIAKRDNAHLHVVSVWDLWMEHALRRRAGNAEIDQALQQRETRVRNDLDRLLHTPCADASKIDIHLRRGPAAANIFTVAEEVEADLIVMGTVCRTGVAGFLIGNTAENLLSRVTCSVLAVKPPGFQSPVKVDVSDSSIQADSLPFV
jgi:nucleotide-binding universal stress UspA family protein